MNDLLDNLQKEVLAIAEQAFDDAKDWGKDSATKWVKQMSAHLHTAIQCDDDNLREMLFDAIDGMNKQALFRAQLKANEMGRQIASSLLKALARGAIAALAAI